MFLFLGKIYSDPQTASPNPPSLLGNGQGTPALPAASGDSLGNEKHGRRPVILNRPFRSVAELGYVFRDEPFKSLDFFSTSSADAALLDHFSVNDESRVVNGQLDSVVAGQVNLSNAPSEVIQAILAGGSKKDFDSTYNMTAAVSGSIARAISAELSGTNGHGPLTNRADLVTRLGFDPSTGNGVIPSGINASPAVTDRSNKAYLEAPVRALADSVNTRTWNLMVDLIAQSGTFTRNATHLNANFIVKGETHYWFHVAIDRYTGQIVDESLEEPPY